MNYDKSFIEVQFPVSKVSKESYKERKAGSSQTLTGLGKWWGRKPLVLVRAALLGLLLPASDEPKKDMDIFLKIMSMDKQGLSNRKTKSISAKDAFDILTTRECELYFAPKDAELAPAWKAGITAVEKATALEKAWSRMSYDQKLTHCVDSIKGKVRLICNSQIEKEDCETATAAADALRREWCGNEPEKVYASAAPRLKRLYELLKSGKLEIKVLPNNVFGLIHGKAGVITLADGSKTSFIGSVNETLSAWRLNYEMLWEDNSPEAIEWVQNEFDYFWQHPAAIPMSDFVVEDIACIPVIM